jgi:hypothetical protein
VNEYTASNGYRIVSVSDTEPVSWLKILNKNPDPEVNERHSLGLYSVEALREFFRAEEAHPEPKPWHAARNGDIWMLELPGYVGKRAYHARDGRFFPVPDIETGLVASDFKDGNLFYREDKS